MTSVKYLRASGLRGRDLDFCDSDFKELWVERWCWYVVLWLLILNFIRWTLRLKGKHENFRQWLWDMFIACLPVTYYAFSIAHSGFVIPSIQAVLVEPLRLSHVFPPCIQTVNSVSPSHKQRKENCRQRHGMPSMSRCLMRIWKTGLPQAGQCHGNELEKYLCTLWHENITFFAPLMRSEQTYHGCIFEDVEIWILGARDGGAWVEVKMLCKKMMKVVSKLGDL